MPDRSPRFGSGCVCTPHYLASASGLAVLAGGGNAVDSAVAANLTLGVVAPYLCGYGGDLFAIVWDGEVHAYAGAGAAPSAATPEAVGTGAMPRFGPLTVTVPGAVDGWFALLDRFGTRSFADLAAHAIAYARDGFPLTERGRAAISLTGARYEGEPWAAQWHSIYGSPGPRLVQSGLARTIEALATTGPDTYYRGEIAEAIASALPLMEPADLDAHRGAWVEPLRTGFRGLEVLEMPPPTQGTAALEALAIADGLDLGRPNRQHLLIETMKASLADRDANLTDPGHMTVAPAALLDPAFVSARRAAIDPDRAGEPEPGRPSSGGTAYLCAADAEGMLVSLIQSNYAGFGSGVTVPGWGINLQNRGAYFSLDPAHPNVIAPSKRTAHTLIPAMAFRDGRPALVFGTMGADGQAQTHLQLLTRITVDGDDVQSAISAPRWVLTPGTKTVSVEPRFGDELLDDLRGRGHDVRVTRPYDTALGHAHAIAVADGWYAAGSDPRAEGCALGL